MLSPFSRLWQWFNIFEKSTFNISAAKILFFKVKYRGLSIDFHWLIFSHCELKYQKLLWRHIMYCMHCWCLKETCSKTKENVINRKFNEGISFTSHSWKYKKNSCRTREIKSIFNVKPLKLLYINDVVCFKKKKK